MPTSWFHFATTNDCPIMRENTRNSGYQHKGGRKQSNDEIMKACQDRSGKVICRIQLWVYNPATKTYAGMTGEGFVYSVRRAETAKDVFRGIKDFVKNWGKG